LYHQAAHDPFVAEAFVAAVAAIDRAVAVVGLAGSALRQYADDAGLRFVPEAFADRGYSPDGHLVPRSEANALITDENQAAKQAIQIVRDQSVAAIDGSKVDITAYTICLHGDHLQAVQFAKRLREDLQAAGIEIRSFA
jgi:UPF0271 protein